ncbi:MULTISPECIES: thiamine pyrophosphate-binding protein [Methanosphaera]|uniref:Predicted thiamine pyrophosphate enzyme n=1 Tax=Methanosphaera stadtmanae (strain ATCC 43021 / DSM 3091 / JCM 11832 / MCB-3) TaxID=339860 RepID=Q2NGW8_METST|nr:MULTISPECIES: thiamine pyrophosphate-binding protein [Methanosphaera]ABC56935.1 predicted thiamine pyrophosphate enzyme [Methanosphaera stadtmanae DSM 3091]OEC85437.1 acetolactate synthase [Methanosphaera sp. A6]
MKIRVADYIAEFLAENNIDTLFTVVGGGAMHLNDGFGHNEDIKCIYNHHEQACAIAAEGYYRMSNKLPAVCVTTGPGGTNALTGVLGAYLDSIPMLVISGQVKYEMTVDSTGLDLRQLGDQEWNIVSTVDSMTKYAHMIKNPNEIKYVLQKALYLATSGRPGPCWIDVPLDIQGAIIDTDDLIEFNEDELDIDLGVKVTKDTIENVISKLKSAKRPVIYAGSAIRTNNAHDEFLKLVNKLQIPVVNAWNATDSLEYDNKLTVGCGGSFGDRPANFAVQNSDLILSLGCRLSTRQVSFAYDKWAYDAYKIMVEIDKAEIEKPTINIDMPIQSDIGDFLEIFNKVLDEEYMGYEFNYNQWVDKCNEWKNKYPVCDKLKYQQKSPINVYAFLDTLSSNMMEYEKIVVANGSACACIHGYKLKKGQRLVVNSGVASMGYDLPAACGACFGIGKKRLVCVSGDGSIQMNLQELQTIVHHKLPIKLFVINNNGYQSIRITQRSFFERPFVGIGGDSGDVSFPQMKKIANAYSIPYYSCNDISKLDETVNKTLNHDGYVMCEIFVDTKQEFEPKSASKKLPDGKMVSAPLEDMKPFLPRDELEENMIIKK